MLRTDLLTVLNIGSFISIQIYSNWRSVPDGTSDLVSAEHNQAESTITLFDREECPFLSVTFQLHSSVANNSDDICLVMNDWMSTYMSWNQLECVLVDTCGLKWTVVIRAASKFLGLTENIQLITLLKFGWQLVHSSAALGVRVSTRTE